MKYAGRPLMAEGEVGPSATLALIAEILSKLRVELVSVGHERGVLRVGDTLLEPHRRVDVSSAAVP